MYRYAFLLTGCFNLIIILIASVNGKCTELFQTEKIQECEKLLQLTRFHISSDLTKMVNSWMPNDLKNICRYKYKLEMCYQLIMLECPNHRNEIHNKLEYMHDTFNYLCNGRIQTYIEALPCLNYIDTSSAIKNCDKINSNHLDKCSKIDKVTTCVSDWTSRSCGLNAGHFIKILLESELSVNLPPRRCPLKSKGEESKCSLNNIETKNNLCASLIGFSEKDLQHLLIDPLPKLNQETLDYLCNNLQHFQSCFERIEQQCGNSNKELLLEHLYYINIFKYICKQIPKDVLDHNYCLTQKPLSESRKACSIKGGRKMLNSTNSMQMCSSLDEAINCSMDITRKFCSSNHYQFMANLYKYGLKSAFFPQNCLHLNEMTTKPADTTTTDTHNKLSNTFSIIVATVAAVCLLVFALIVGICVSVCGKKKNGQQRVINRPSSNIITRPNFVTPTRLPPYTKYESSSAPPPYNEAMAEDYRSSNRF